MRKYDDYDEDELYGNDDDENAVKRAPAQVESFSRLDLLFAGGLALLSAALMWLGAFPGLVPDAWEHAAIGAGVRPLADIFSGLWNVIARGLYSIGGISLGTLLVRLLGQVFAGLSVGIVYLLLRAILFLAIRERLKYARRRFIVIRGTALLGAALFACSDPLWRAGQAFTPPLLLTFLTVLALALFFNFLMSGGMGQIYWSMFLLGFVSAETPMGFFLVAFCWGVYFIALRHGAIPAGLPLLNPIVEQKAKWYLTFLYAIGLIGGIAANCGAFVWLDGQAAMGVVGGDMPLMYATRWWNLFIHAATPRGWGLGLGVCVMPFVVGAVLLPRAVDEDRLLPYHLGVVYFATGLLAFTQVAELPSLWFWTWIPGAPVVNSSYFLQILVLLSSTTVVFALTVMTVDGYCRDHERLTSQDNAEADAGAITLAKVRKVNRAGMVIVPLLLLAAVVLGRFQGQTRHMLKIVNDYGREVLAECGDAKWIFTDGSFDSYLELAAAENGKSLRALSMVSGNSPREQFIRRRGVTDKEDRMVLTVGAPMALRTWMRDKPERMKDAAIQLGFELWKRDGKEIPVCSGVLSRPIGMTPEACAKGVKAANELADRILKIYADGGPSRSAGHLVNQLFLFVQWRISRLARMRAERADRAGDTEGALKDVKLSDELDNNNASLQRILADMEKARATTLKQVTPREGLQLALARADFALARRYAEPILEANPEDPNANFGVGMSYFMQKQWARAEEYLRRCLVKKPKEPAIWNNLAMICKETGRFDEGIQNAQKALEIIPDSAEVKDTIQQIKKAKEEAAKKKAEAEKAAAAKKKVDADKKTPQK